MSLQEVLASAVLRWMTEENKSIYDALGELFAFTEYLKVIFAYDVSNTIRDARDWKLQEAYDAD
jgi:hypothetical protein